MFLISNMYTYYLQKVILKQYSTIFNYIVTVIVINYIVSVVYGNKTKYIKKLDYLFWKQF